MLRTLVASMALALAASPALCDEPTVVELGGVRKVSATIKREAEDFEIVVRMLSVRCFDKATNARLNREKAKGYALHALIRHLNPNGGKAARAVVSGATIRSVSTEGQFFVLTLIVPRNGVRLKEAINETEEPADKPSQELLLSAKSLLGRRDDYSSTVTELANLFRSEADAAVSAKVDADGKFLLAIADLEEQAETQFGRLKTEVEDDKLLLTAEKDELGQYADAEFARFVNRLRKAVEEREGAKGKERSR